jgi:signal transduction histidine kinase
VGLCGLFDAIISPEWASAVEREATMSVGASFVYAFAPLAILLHGLLLLRRSTYPFGTVALTSALAIALPISPAAPLVALSSAIAHGRLARPRLSVALVTAAVAVSTWRDVRSTTAGTSTLRTIFASQTTESGAYVPLALPQVLATAGIALAAAIALGLVRLAVRRQRRAERTVVAVENELDEARSESSRRAEREAVAREIHDGLGGRLSTLSLESQALAVAAADRPDLRERAERIHQQSARAVADLTSLVRMLHGTSPEPLVTLDHLSELLDARADAGQPLSSTVRIESAASAPDELARAVHRIVSELTTNAERHAHGLPLRLSVVGTPAEGIRIRASNPVPAGDASSDGAGSGLNGIVERARLIGGAVTIDDSNGFVVDVYLPWEDRA